MAEGKRKTAPTGASNPSLKKKKGGNSGRWTTTHHQSKLMRVAKRNVQPGDVGIWVTCARHQEQKAIREVTDLFNEYAETLIGIKQREDVPEDDCQDEIEAAIQKEIQGLGKNGNSNADSPFVCLKMNIECVVFVKTKSPVRPDEFVRRICQDIKYGTTAGRVRCPHVNRLTPSVVIGKATALSGVIDVARQVMRPFFDLSRIKEEDAAKVEASRVKVEAEESKDQANGNAVQAEENQAAKEQPVGEEEPAENHLANQKLDNAQSVKELSDVQDYSFAIRPTLRNHNTLTRSEVIDAVARLVNTERHKVNLSSPDKVILIDIFQNVCGMSVVDGDWETLKRYNLTELQHEAREKKLKPASEQTTSLRLLPAPC